VLHVVIHLHRNYFIAFINYFVVSEKVRKFAVDNPTEYHEVIGEESAIFASKVVQLPLK
jgi:hypothetical protein